MKSEGPNVPGVLLTLPDWLKKMTDGKDIVLPDPAERMRWVIHLSRLNVENRSGGPFAAGIFTQDSGRLMAAGVNRVEPLNLSPAHAEVMAIAFAQKKARSWDLGGEAVTPTELVTSSQPCLMCLGAVLWSGVTRLCYGAAADDVGSILGFDEGPLPQAWKRELEKRGIKVEGGRLRDEAVAVLERYRDLGGTVYKSRRGF